MWFPSFIKHFTLLSKGDFGNPTVTWWEGKVTEQVLFYLNVQSSGQGTRGYPAARCLQAWDKWKWCVHHTLEVYPLCKALEGVWTLGLEEKPCFLSKVQGKRLWGHWEVGTLPREVLKLLVCGWRISGPQSFFSYLVCWKDSVSSVNGLRDPCLSKGAQETIWVGGFPQFREHTAPSLVPSCLPVLLATFPLRAWITATKREVHGDKNRPHLDWGGSWTTVVSAHLSESVELST